MDGILNIYKEKGYTSHDVVARMRGILHMKKIGHTGTLDPDAEGVLPVCVGAATKLCDLMTEKTKSYEACLHLGVKTDTQDIGGKVLEEDSCFEKLSEEQIREAVMSFLGDQMQIPPMYSALKVNGKKLYEYARAGIVIERSPRPISIYDIKILDISLPYIRFTVNCSKGTYIRTLCEDIGARMGVPACMESLKRIRVGGFLIKDSIRLEELESLASSGLTEEKLVKIDDIFSSLPAKYVQEQGEKFLYNGNELNKEWLVDFEKSCIIDGKITDFLGISEKFSDCIRIYNKEKNFIGLYRFDDEKQIFCPIKLFFVNNGAN